MLLYNLNIRKYFYLELRLCPQLTGYFTLPNIELQSSSLLTLQVMYSVHEMMKHCLNRTLRFGGFFCIISLALCQEYLAFFFEKFYYPYWEFHIIHIGLGRSTPTFVTFPVKKKKRKIKKKKNPYIQDGREDSGVKSTCSCRDLSFFPDTYMETLVPGDPMPVLSPMPAGVHMVQT